MDTATQSKAKFGGETQEHLVKLAILTIAAILCESKMIYLFFHLPEWKYPNDYY